MKSIALAVLSAALLLAGPAQAQDKNADKAARRLQLQLRALQQQVQEAQAAKGKVEADKAAADQQLQQQSQQVTRLGGSLRRSGDQLKAAEKQRDELAATVAALEKRFAEQQRAADEALAAKTQELEQSVKLRDARQAEWQRRHDEQLAQVGECSAKNERLLRLGAELVERYRGKSVGDVLRQRDPLLGLGDVQMFNLVQETRDRIDAERFSPSPHR
ncbi:MAG TPA: hypothetical protein VLI72_16785 [Methylibium sp.]|nr:hypothetical protein [Methylibium sp.]